MCCNGHTSSSPTLLNQATIGYSRNQITQITRSNRPTPSGAAIRLLYNANIYNLIPTITISGFSSIGAQGLTNNTNNVYTWRDDVTKQLHNSLAEGRLQYPSHSESSIAFHMAARLDRSASRAPQPAMRCAISSRATPSATSSRAMCRMSISSRICMKPMCKTIGRLLAISL